MYIPESEEHCFVLFSDSNEYKVWISRMGDIDITGTRTISEQPYAGVLFKSQNASTWTADQYEDLKFNLYRAKFNTSVTGSAVFNNASLGAGNDGLASLVNNPITTIQPQQNITLATGVTYAFTVGARVIQSPSNAQGTVKEFDSTSDPQILTVTDISGTFVQGIVDNSGNITNAMKSSQSSATIVLSAISNGVFEVGDVITGSSSGATATVTAYDVGTSTITANYVSKAFDVGNDTLSEPGGVSGTISSASYSGDSYTGYPVSQPTVRAGDKKIIVYQPNHGMHNRANNVELKNVVSEIPATTLTSNLSSTATTLSVNDAGSFHKVVNGKPISTTNPGYVMLVGESSDNLALDPPSPPGGDDDATEAWRSIMHVVSAKEIIAYSAISDNGKEITVAPSGRGITSAVMNTGAALTWPSETTVRCYNLDGIPLTEINKVHTAIGDPTLDTYSLSTQSVASVGIATGGSNVSASQNIPFELITPTIQVLNFKETDIAPTLNTTSGTSIGTGGQVVDQASFVNNGQYDEIQLNEENYYDNPRIICSNINEANKLEGSKSLTMRINMMTEKDNLTPVIDLDRVSVITTSNRINKWPGGPQVLGIQSEIDTTGDVSLLAGGDQNEAIYLTKIAKLANISRSIRLMISMQRYGDSTIDIYYRIQKAGSDKPMNEVGFVKIPVPDVGSTNVGEEEWEDFEYTVEGQEFQAFQIKIVMKAMNQAKVPLIKDLRAIAFAS